VRERDAPLYGRVYVVPSPKAGVKRGLTVTVLAGPGSEVSSVSDLGVRGGAARVLETLRFE
jgi:hypothetical protein